MATPGLGLFLALGLMLLPARWGRARGETVSPTASSTMDGHTTVGGLSTEGLTAIIVVFSILGALIVIVLLVLLVRKLREKRQTEGTYRPSVEEQFSHTAEARAPQDSKEKVRGCLPI
uniref:Crumbs cell polarity complex component 3 n=1 Tax=Cavia porcellus TaxID=10141 RepID=H0VZN0_CAVPO